MRILVDSADLAAIREALASGFVRGVTTNPTLLRRAGVQTAGVADLARAAIEAGADEVHLQAYAEDAGGMVREGRELAAIDPARVRVKLVATPPGYRAARALAARGTAVTLTGVYTLRQALAAESVRAKSIAIYLGRLRDAGQDPLALAGRMQQLLDAQDAEVEILAASIRDPDEIVELALLGVASVTVAPPIIARLLESPATADAAATFGEDAAALREDPAAISEDAAAIREDPAAIREDPAAIREDPAAIREDPAALRDDSAAIRGDTAALHEP